MTQKHACFVAVLCTGLATTVSSQTADSDFNGDGFDDLAVGIPGQDVDGVIDAGAVAVLYGSAGGLDVDSDQLWDMSNSGLPGGLANSGAMGEALAVGDFDGNGRSDLAIGIPDYNVGSKNDVGAVLILYGTGGGLKANNSQLWHRDVNGILGNAGRNARFGSELAAGDFDNDGRDDLAIGAASADVGGREDAGDIHILYGSGNGLSAARNQVWSQDSNGIADSAEAFDLFGFALCSGNFNGDDSSDLAVGVPFDDIGGVSAAGAVHIIFGGPNGLGSANDQFLVQGQDGLADEANIGDSFGTALAAGRMNKGRFDDLLVGVPGEVVNGAISAGAVQAIYGSGGGLTGTSDQVFHQNIDGMKDSPELNDNFGYVVAVGNLLGGSQQEAIVGIAEGLGPAEEAGAVQIVKGSTTGLQADGNQFWNEDKAGVSDLAETDDLFGAAVTHGDYNGDGRRDLVVGVPGQTVSGAAGAGAIHVFYGSSSGLSTDGTQWLHQDSDSVRDVAEPGDGFGSALR